jgi:hypothetical protein
MPREDLLHLTPDDLAALTNRGTVKRAQRELEANEVTADLAEDAKGTVVAQWSDGVTCTLPGGKTLSDARCTCPATELCRHAVRTVLAYQLSNASDAPKGEGETAPAPVAWNPGDISDDELAKHFKPVALGQARAQYEKGLLVELLKSHKPSVRFHDLACTLWFQVPGDPRYVHCDCAGAPPCAHVPLAVWAFRHLPEGQFAGIVSTQKRSLPVPVEALDRVESVLLEGAETGLAGAGPAWRDKLARAEATCRDAALVWPADVLADLVHRYEQYAAHDARFAPDEFADLVGELALRADAIRNDTGAVPQPLVRGSANDRVTELGSARYIGLGCGVKVSRRCATVVAYLQDADSGSMVAVSREFPDPADDSPDQPKPFWQLAQTVAVKGATYAMLGAGQLLAAGGKRSTSYQLVLGRTSATVNMQAYTWEQLRPPVLAERFADARARLGALPPAALRTRRVAENFQVCAVREVEYAAFRPDTQTVEAVVFDAGGEPALLRHPFTGRGEEGAERMLARLTAEPGALRFVAGHARLSGAHLVIEPVALVFDGAVRSAVQPWVDRLGDAPSAEKLEAEGAVRAHPCDEWARDLLSATGELFLTGLKRAGAPALKAWRDLAARAEQLGLARMGALAARVATGLEAKASTAKWDPRPTAAALLRCAALARLAREVT